MHLGEIAPDRQQGCLAVLGVIGKVDWPICNVICVFRFILAHSNARVLGLSRH